MHIPVLVEMLLELQRNGVQIFISTHDYILAKYFEVRLKKQDKIRFYSFYKENNIKSLFVEYKNANIEGAVNAKAFEPKSDKKINNVVRKFLRNKIAERLPIRFQQLTQFKRRLIEGSDVLSIDEWNSHPEYSNFPITKIHT